MRADVWWDSRSFLNVRFCTGAGHHTSLLCKLVHSTLSGLSPLPIMDASQGSQFQPASLGLPADFRLTNYSKLKG